MLIYDHIYGYIKIDDFLYSFLTAPEFQRLGKIKQLGFADFIFPNAKHTRLEHSIGVLHVTMKMMDELLSSDRSLFTEREYKLICLAALYHDIGHSAFSHLFDSFLETFSENNEDDQIPLFFRHKKHEDRSVYLLKKVNRRLMLITEEEEEFIKHVILGVPQQGRKKYLYQILSTNTLDSDRIDYLTRDGYYTRFHHFKFLGIIRGIRVIDEQIHYCSDKKHQIEKFIKIRRDMYQKVYLNQTLFNLNTNVVEKMHQLGKMVFKYNEKTNDEHILSFLKIQSSPLTSNDDISRSNIYIEYKPDNIKDIDIDEIRFFS